MRTRWPARGSMLRVPQRRAADSAAPTTGGTQDTERRWRRLQAAAPWLVVFCYLVGAVAVAARLWADPAGREQFAGVGDNELFAWFVRYAATAVAHGHLPALVTTGMNAPQGFNLMWNTSFLLPGVLLTLVTLPAGPEVSLTVALTVGFAGSAASLFWVLRRWGASLGAAALGGATRPPVSPVPAGWQATFTRLRLPADAPVLVLPFPPAPNLKYCAGRRIPASPAR
jgi:hypothetical protein